MLVVWLSSVIVARKSLDKYLEQTVKIRNDASFSFVNVREISIRSPVYLADYERHASSYIDDLSDIYHVHADLTKRDIRVMMTIRGNAWQNRLPQIAADQLGIFTNWH
jgi:methionine synthase II (cobalamin-independent)